MKVYVSADEWYPVFEISRSPFYRGDPKAHRIDLSSADFARFRNAMKEFTAVQQMVGIPYESTLKGVT